MKHNLLALFFWLGSLLVVIGVSTATTLLVRHRQDTLHVNLRRFQDQQVIELRAQCEGFGGMSVLVYREDDNRWVVGQCILN